jgi:hypothetical protein
MMVLLCATLVNKGIAEGMSVLERLTACSDLYISSDLPNDLPITGLSGAGGCLQFWWSPIGAKGLLDWPALTNQLEKKKKKGMSDERFCCIDQVSNKT